MSIVKNNYPLSVLAAYVFIGKAASFVLAILIPIILVRIFSKDNYGVYQQMLLVSMFLVDIIKWGLINSLFYFYPLEKEKRTQLLSQTFYLLVIAGIILLPSLYHFRYSIADLFNSPIIATLIFPICFYFFFMLTSLILDSLFILEKKSRVVVIYEIINKTLRGLFVIGTALVFKDVYYVLWSLTIFALIRVTFLYIYMKKIYGIKLRKVEIPLLKSQLRYAFPIGSARMVGEIGKKIDKFILAAFLTPAYYATYSIAHFGIPFIGLFYTSVSQVIIPQMTIKKKAEDLVEIKRLWHRMIDQFSLVTIPIVIIFGLLANNIITLLFTEQYIESVPVYRIFLFIIILHIVNPSVVLRACKKTKTIFISHLWSMIIALFLGYILIKNYGMIGGAISFILSSFVRTLIQVTKVKKILSLSLISLLPWYSMLKIILFSLIAAIFPIIIINQDMNNIVTVTFSGIGYTLVILSVYFYTGMIKYRKVIEFAKSISR